MKLKNTPVQQICFQQQTVFVKRDDLLSKGFTGNKARKFYHFLQQDLSGVDKLIGHGSPQANSLFSLSELAKLRQCQLDFYVDHIPSYLREHPRGNYRAALENGANIIALDGQVDSVLNHIREQVLPKESNALFIPEGGRCRYAEVGVKILADEILQWANLQGFSELRIVLPSGTGTTALFLQKNLPFDVFTCACVGGDPYLKQQFFELEEDSALHPKILSAGRKYHFGKLYPEFYAIWQHLRAETGIEFDLLYDPLAWICLQQLLNADVADSRPVLYIHQGGLLGNETMLPRYLRKLALQREPGSRK